MFFTTSRVSFSFSEYTCFCRIRVGEDSCEMQTTGVCMSQERLIFELESFRTSYLMFRRNHRTM